MALINEDLETIFNLDGISLSFIPVGKLPMNDPKKMKAPFDNGNIH